MLVLQAPFSLLDDLARMVAEVHRSVLLASNVINLHTAYWFEAALLSNRSTEDRWCRKSPSIRWKPYSVLTSYHAREGVAVC